MLSAQWGRAAGAARPLRRQSSKRGGELLNSLIVDGRQRRRRPLGEARKVTDWRLESALADLKAAFHTLATNWRPQCAFVNSYIVITILEAKFKCVSEHTDRIRGQKQIRDAGAHPRARS